MGEIWAIVFGLSMLLALAVVLQPVAKMLRIPHTVLLAAFGAGLAWAVQYLGIDLGISEIPLDGGHGAEAAAQHGADAGHGAEHLPIWKQALGALTGLNITADVILFVFLPALVFESSLSLDLRKLQREIGVILFLAIVGVLISTAIAGVALSSYSGMSLVACLLIGAIISATDPVAVIALFKDLGAPKRLTILVEGESLFNDATAIVVATIFLTLISSTAEPDILAATFNFMKVFFGGIIIGVLIGRAFIAIMIPFKRNAISVVSLTLVTPFVAFVTAEHFLHVSGVMAAVVCGLSLGSYGRKVIPPQIFEEIEHSWHQIAFWATALIFILVGTAVPALLGDHFVDYIDDAIILFIIGTLARTLIIFVFIPLLSGIGVMDRVSRAYQTIMVWGGLRGAVSLALALVVLNTSNVDQEIKAFVGVLVTVFVLATLTLQATTISIVMGWLGLGELAPVDKAMRERSLAWARRSVREELDEIVTERDDDAAHFSDILDQYDTAAAAAEQAANEDALSRADWVRMGLNLALGQERQFYLEAYGDGAVSPARLRELLARTEDTIEAVRITTITDDNDLRPLQTAVEQSMRHSDAFARALNLQRRFGITSPLADALATRFSILSSTRTAIDRQTKDGLKDIAALLPPKASDQFHALFQHRRETIEKAHQALWLQYPEFALSVDRRNLTRIGLRLEGLAYERLKENGLIGPEVYGDLIQSLEERSGKSPLPKLRLNYNAVALISNVPLFADTTGAERKKIARKLRPVFFTPSEKIIGIGEPGDSMFFIADGAVEIHLPDGSSVELGSGQFIGEIALLTGDPRTADVISQGYSTLLKLGKSDFDALMRKNPGMAAHIKSVARTRQ